MAYASWWEIDKKVIYITLMTHTPIGGIDMNQLGNMFGVPPSTVPSAAQPSPDMATSVWGMEMTQATMAGSAYGWLTFATIAYCALAFSGGTAIGKFGGSILRRGALVLLGLCVMGFAWGVYTVLNQYGQQYPPRLLRTGMCALAILAMLAGLSRGRHVKRWSRIAAFSLIVSAAVTVVALYLGHQCAAIDDKFVTPLYLATIFAIQSAYGWLLWPISSRL